MAQTDRSLRDAAETTPHIDAVCDDFEAEWLARKQPLIEDFLPQVSEPQRSALFEELLALELDYRQRAGETLDRGQYKARFAAYETIVERRFGILQAPLQSFGDVKLADAPPMFPRRMGDYELLGVLGRGGMGEVYRARHVHLDRVVALKILPEHSLCDSQAISRFKQERKLLARLDHPHIVRALDAREEGGKYMLAMEHVEGASLDRLAAGQQPIGIAEACELTRQAAEGLQYAYEHGLIHRDIKPSNLMLSGSGVLKILDFGLARMLLGDLAGDLDHLTTTPLGTLDYMAPEQFDDAHRVDTRADVYSLGCTLFQLLCGSAPFSSENRSLLAKMKAHCMAPIPSLRERRGDAPAELERILCRMLAKHPADRFASPGEVAAALAPFAAGARLEMYCNGPLVASRLVMPKSLDQPAAEIATNDYQPAGTVHSANAAPAGLLDQQERFVQSLPLPVSELYLAAQRARTPAERRHSAYCLWEASLRLLGSVLLVKFGECGQRPGAPLQQALENLAWPSALRWWQVVQEVLPALAKLGDARAAQVGELLLGEDRDDLPACAQLAAALDKACGAGAPAAGAVRIASLFDALTEYGTMLGRSRGESQTNDDVEQVGTALLAAMTELLGRLNVLVGGRLRYVEKVGAQASGDCTVDSIELSGSSPRRQSSSAAPHGDAQAAPRAGRLYLDFPPASLPTALAGSPLDRAIAVDALLWYDPESNEFFFLNARRDEPQAEYLCYKTGRTHRPSELAETLAALLGRLLGKPLGHEALRQFAEHSTATEATTMHSASHTATRVIGDFELLSRIGAGGMGVVYRAWQRSLDRQVALKCVTRTGDRQTETRFAREIRTLGRIEHPNLVKIYTSGSDDDRLFYAMELIEGATLASVCQKLQVNTTSTAEINLKIWRASLSTACAETRTAEQPVSSTVPVAAQRPIDGLSEPTRPRLASESYVRNIVHLIRQAADAVHALHEAGAVHRDIKPGNIMVTSDGSQAVLMDLGLVQLADEVDGSLTRTTQFVGTLRYASPEQLLGRAMQIDRRTDVYSLGVTLWELLTLRPIYGANDQTSTPELIQRIQGEEPEPIRKHYPQVDRDLEAIVMKCLEKARAARYATAAELSADLGCWLRGERPHGVRSISLVAWRKFAARNKRRVTTGGALAAMLVATALLAAYFSKPPVVPTVPVTAVVEQLPGLNGQWWFEETPWLVPAARTVAGKALSDPKTLASLAPPGEEEQKPLDLNDRDVVVIQSKLRLAVDRSALAADPLIGELEKLSTDSLDGKELAERLREVLGHARRQSRDREVSAEDVHLQGALEHRIALTAADKDAARRADDLYHKTLGLYEKDSPLYALCLGDYARLNAGILDNYALAMQQFDELLQIKEASPTATVANLCAKAEAYNAQDDFRKANEVYELALAQTEHLADGHPLTGFVHKAYGWNLLDHWMVEKARTHFKKSQDIQSGNSDLGNPLAKIEYFHARHGLALADRYSGRAKLARQSYRYLIEEVREEIAKGNHATGVNRLLHQRLYNSLERCADSTLYESALADDAADDLDLEQTCREYAEARLEAAEPTSKAAMTYKWIIAMALTKDRPMHEAARGQYEAIAKESDVGAGYDRERVNLLKQVAAAVLLRAEESAAARQALQEVLAYAQVDEKRKTRRESLELQLLCAEILVSSAASSEASVQARDALEKLVESFPSPEQMQPFLQRYRQLLGDPQAHKPIATTSKERDSALVVRKPVADPDGSRRPELHLLSVGVSDNQRPDFRLQFAHHDAEELAALYPKLCESPFGAFEAGTQITLVDKKASRSNILTELEHLKRNVHQGDVVLVTMSGHGVTNAAGNFFFLPYDLPDDFNEDRLRDKAISWAELGDSLRELTQNPGAAMTVLVMDACHSGSLVAAGARGAVLLDNEIGKSLAEFQNKTPAGLFVIGACRGNQTASENAHWKHGALTLALLEAIEGKHRGQPGKVPLPDGGERGWVSLEDVVRYADDRVKELTGEKRQRVVYNQGDLPLDEIRLVQRAAKAEQPAGAAAKSNGPEESAPKP